MPTNTKTMMKAMRLLEEFRKLDPEMQMQTAQAFIYVAIHPGTTMKQLGDALGISQASCSRNIAALSKWHRLDRPGHDLVVAQEDPAERRRKIVTLTPKGKRIAKALLDILEDEVESAPAA